MAIGSKPALTGTKLSQNYFRGDNYLEVDIDIGSSSVAANILSLVSEMCPSMSYIPVREMVFFFINTVGSRWIQALDFGYCHNNPREHKGGVAGTSIVSNKVD